MKFQIMNPVAEKVQEKGALAPRLKSLEGKHIGLYWNFKGGGDAALKRTSELLQAKYPGVTTKLYTGSLGGSNHLVTKADAKRLAQECAGMVGTTAD
jgi:hypothetical protein